MSVQREEPGQRTRGGGCGRHRSEAHAAEALTAAVPPVPFDHEDLVVRKGRRSGRYVIVAIHSTALGPALGGVRLWHYEATVDGARDALGWRGE